jgi:putative thiamine transport system permease protein
VALVWTVAWLELAPAHWQRRATPLLMMPLALPGVLWVMGMHQLSLAWALDGQASGLWLAHTLACLPYVLLALQGPYTAFDPRLARLCATLGQSRAAFLWRVKWPLLRAAFSASFAVGLAVSVAQYLPTLYIGAGRFQTVSTEAVALASGGQRSMAAAYAWLQWLLPLLGFAAAAWLGRPRQFAASATVQH